MSKTVKMMVGVLLAVMVAAGGFYSLTMKNGDTTGSKNSASTGQGSQQNGTGGSTGIDNVPTGDAAPKADPRTGEAPDPFLIEFMKKLNEVHMYVWTNKFDKATEIDAIYQQLWAWGESEGLRIRGVLTQSAIDHGDTQFTPQAAPFLELQTSDGLQYCAADVTLFDPNYSSDEVLRQELLPESCSALFEKLKSTGSTTTSPATPAK